MEWIESRRRLCSGYVIFLVGKCCMSRVGCVLRVGDLTGNNIKKVGDRQS